MYNIDIYANRMYITSVNKKYVFFRLPDNTQTRVKHNKKELVALRNYFEREYIFYTRMYTELRLSYDTQIINFRRTHHYYSETEIKEAQKNNRMAIIDMEISNKYYMGIHKQIYGILKEALRVQERCDGIHKLLIDTNNIINMYY